MGFLIAIPFLLILSFFVNHVAQRALPTFENDDQGRRVTYRILVQIIGYGAIGTIAGIVYFSVRDSLLKYSEQEIVGILLMSIYVFFYFFDLFALVA